MTLSFSNNKKWFSTLIMLLLLVYSCSSNISAEEPKKLSTSLKKIIEESWSKNLTELQEVFPGGRFTEGDIKKRYSAYYQIKVILTDIDLSGDLYISQRQEEINSKNQSYPPLRSLLISNTNQESFEIGYKKIKYYLKEKYSVGDGSATIKNTDGYFIPFNRDYSDGIAVDINVSENNGKKYIKLYFQKPQPAE